ncbi:hypothetical protein O2K51_05340 [Apibacter raozihei]|uniref:hypothetical protein n=1 Tax=Apibacter raozihei TaxID=2500547 RepID=UPI000FE3AA3D|nr:hypothetical protein [Apibacter raozihei]
MNKILILLILLFCCLACNKDKYIVGLYKIDKYVILNQENNIENYQYLEIRPEGIFNAFHCKTDTINQIQGKWKFSSKTNDNGLLIQFEYEGKKIEGTLKGNIFHFIHPNDFHNNKYQSVLYIKSLK